MSTLTYKQIIASAMLNRTSAQCNESHERKLRVKRFQEQEANLHRVQKLVSKFTQNV